MQFSSKTVVITGGGRGIGRAMALAFAREGAAVVVAERDAQDGQAVAEQIVSSGGQALFLACDVSRREDVYGALDMAAETFGGLDVLINNAGCLSPNVLLEDKTDEMLDQTIKVGMWGTWWGMKAALPHFRRRGGGRIINFYSNDADSGAWMHADHNAGKLAILGLTRSAAAEWGRYNIRVNAICPAAAGTVFQQMKIDDPEFVDRWCYQNPAGWMGDPERDIAPVALFLASEASRYITGEVIHVDGGQHLARRSSKPAGLPSVSLAEA